MHEQPTTRNLDNDIPSKTCRLRNREGRFYLVKQGGKNSRVANLEPPRGTGFIVPNSELYDSQGNSFDSTPRQRMWYHQPAYTEMPYGIKDVLPKVIRDGERIKCYVKDCSQFVRPPRKHQPGELCPHHGIYSHASLTFTYPAAEAYRNVLADRGLFDALNSHSF